MTDMHAKRHIQILLPCLLATACAESDNNSESEALREIGRLVLANGNVVLFADQDPSDELDIALIEFPATPGPGAVEAMTAENATPADLWLSASKQPLPTDLARAHSAIRDHAPRSFVLSPQLLEAPAGVQFRDADYANWGGYDGYCSDPAGFIANFQSFAGSAGVSLGGSLGNGGTIDAYIEDATDVWMGVCNNDTWGGTTPTSAMRLYQDIGVWNNMNCPHGDFSWCHNIGEQSAKAMHYWSGTVKTFKASAVWNSGIVHSANMRVRAENNSSDIPLENHLCDPLDDDPDPETTECQNYCVMVSEYCTGWVGHIDEPYVNYDDCLDYCNCNWQPGTYSEPENTTNCRLYAYGEYGPTCDAFDRDNQYCYE